MARRQPARPGSRSASGWGAPRAPGGHRGLQAAACRPARTPGTRRARRPDPGRRPGGRRPWRARPGDDGLAAGAGVAAPDPVDLGGGPGPDPLQGAEALLAVGGAACPARRATPARQRAARRRAPAPARIVAAPGRRSRGSVTRPVLVCSAGQPGRLGARVGHPAAEGAGVDVLHRPGQVDLAVRQPAHAGAHGRGVRGPHAGVADDDHVAASRSRSRRISAAKFGEPDSSSPSISSLMLTGGAVRPVAARCARCQGMEEHLALVVRPRPGRAAGRRARRARTAAVSHSSSGSTGWTSWCP